MSNEAVPAGFPIPDLNDVELVTVLKGLADPARLAVVAYLADGAFHPCTVDAYGLNIHKSTLSHHFKVLRESGITRTRVEGRDHSVQLRRDELDERFPGLLSGILGEISRRA